MTEARPARWNRCQRWAVWLAAGPLAFGLAVQATWWFTQWDPLMVVGLVTVFVGAAMGLVAGGLATLGWAFAAHAGEPLQRGLGPAALAFGLVLTGFVTAWLCIEAAVARRSGFTIDLRNEAAAPWSDLVLTGSGVEQRVAAVPAAGSLAVTVWFSEDGNLRLREESAVPPREHEILGYATRNQGGRATVTRDRDGAVRVEASTP